MCTLLGSFCSEESLEFVHERFLLARITPAKKTKGRVVAEEFHCIRRGWRRAGWANCSTDATFCQGCQFSDISLI